MKKREAGRKRLDDEPFRRLLDMLAGWSAFASEDRHAAREASTVGALYQRAGALDPGTRAQVRRFMLDVIVPFVMTGIGPIPPDKRPDGTVEALPYALEALGRSLRAARKEAGLTAAQLAGKLGTRRLDVIHAEKGLNLVEPKYVRKVLKACGLPSSWRAPPSR